MKKNPIELATVKPRNWTVLALAERSGGGRHGKSEKAKRQEDKKQLRRNTDWF